MFLSQTPPVWDCLVRQFRETVVGVVEKGGLSGAAARPASPRRVVSESFEIRSRLDGSVFRRVFAQKEKVQSL